MNEEPGLAIPATKLAPPQLGAELLPRPALAEQVYQAASSHRLTLVSAPAGAGKTTAVLQFLEAHPDLSVAWLSLDAGDDEGGRFLQALLAAIQHAHPGFSPDLREVLQATTGANAGALPGAAVLVNAFLANIRQLFFIVLEDLHRVEAMEINQILNYLLERLPENIHLIATSRHDPPLRLAQLRSQGQLAEFRLEHLRFSPQELKRLLNQVLALDLSPGELALVEEGTEGWAAGVKLLTLSLGRLAGAQQRADLIRHLSASQRLLFDFLVEEVLNQLPAGQRDFLLQTSILDELTPAVCQALTGRQDAAAVLESLYHQNLFITVVEGRGSQQTAYRYHDLFARFLQKQLGQRPDLDARALHLRAAKQQLSREGRIPHLLAAQAWDQVIEELIALGKTQSGVNFIPGRTIKWINQVPEVLRAEHYWLGLIVATYQRQQGNLKQSWERSKDILAQAEEAEDVDAIMDALWNLGFFITAQEDRQWGQRMQQLVEEKGEQLSPARHSQYAISSAWMALNLVDWPTAEQHLDDFLEIVRQGDDLGLYYTATQHLGPQWLFATKGIDPIERLDDELLRRVGEQQDGVLQAGSFMRRAWIAYMSCDLSAAQTYAARAQRGVESIGGMAYLTVSIDMIRMMLMLAKAEYAQLLEFVGRREGEFQDVDTHRSTLPAYWFCAWRAHWLQGQFEAMPALMAQVLDVLDDSDRRDSPIAQLMQGWQRHIEGKPIEAEAAFVEAARRHRRLRWTGTRGNPLIDQALFYLAIDEEGKALACWKEAASEMRQRGMPGQLLATGRKVIPLLELAVQRDQQADIAMQALEAFGQAFTPHAIPIPDSNEALTPRESEVLSLLMVGASNQQIAEELVVTERTAKAHVSHILHKLGVSSRTEAVARAHELSLL